MRFALVSVALVTLMSACVSQPEPISRRLTDDTFDDVPAPESAVFRTEAGESFAFQSSGFRCGRFVFDYPGADTEAVIFFKETMQRPPFSWKLTNEQREVEGSMRLTLVKGGDTCTINVDRVPARETVVLTLRVNYRK